MMNFYVVTGGRCSGIFTSRDLVLDATVGYPGARYRKFSTLKEAEEAMKEHSGETKPPLKWTGEAYAVAVGRRMGIFTHQEALNQIRHYPANSMKRFDSYEEAVEFLDKHNWRKMLNSPFEDGKHLQAENSWATDSNVPTGTNSSSEKLLQRATKTIRMKIQCWLRFLRSTRKKTAKMSEEPNIGEPDIFYVFCDGFKEINDHGGDDILSVCAFPNHSEWDVEQLLTSEDSTMLQAGLLAMKEAFKRANKEDPERKAEMIIFTDTWEFYTDLNGYNGKAGVEGDFYLDMYTEKGDREVHVSLFHQGYQLPTGPKKSGNA
ncbi:hypothetical protein DVH05_001333 [Phytophthora capsici]|nr:hypothetical protein DVH05_001333 [Phytophthora capsici]